MHVSEPNLDCPDMHGCTMYRFALLVPVIKKLILTSNIMRVLCISLCVAYL